MESPFVRKPKPQSVATSPDWVADVEPSRPVLQRVSGGEQIQQLDVIDNDEDFGLKVVEPVDGQVVTLPETGEGSRLAVLPDWAKTRTGVVAQVDWFVRDIARTIAFHAVRTPGYYVRLVGRSPYGLAKVSVKIVDWVRDAKSNDDITAFRAAVSESGRGTAELGALAEAKRKRVKNRLIIAAVAATLLMLGVLSVGRWWPALLLVMAGVLGFVGRDCDRPVTGRSTVANRIPRLTSDLITEALITLGIGELNKAHKLKGDRAIGFISPIVRHGNGWRADIDLPAGVTAQAIIDKRQALASGLRRPLGCVWPEVDPDAHEGRLILYVADQPLAKRKLVPWPYEKTGAVNIFEPVNIGTDQRGDPVTIVLMFASGLIGAIPRMGKTFALRLICLAAVLDPRTELHAYNLKGGGDFKAFVNVAHAYRVGDSPDDIQAALTDLKAMVKEMQRRYKVVEQLPEELCPESKVTDKLASDKKLKLHPILLAADECQIWFGHPEHGKEFIALCTDLVKRGPAVAIMMWFATQKPDAESIPTSISDNAALRFCLKVMAQDPNDRVLGTSMYKAGHRATIFSRKDLGIGLLAGEANDPQIVRTSFIDNPAAKLITARARAAKAELGWLSGLAAGNDPNPDTDTRSTLDHLIAVWPETEPALWCETLAERLQNISAVYEGWDAGQVTAALKPHDITTKGIKLNNQNRVGLKRTILQEKLLERNQPPEPQDTIQPTQTE